MKAKYVVLQDLNSIVQKKNTLRLFVIVWVIWPALAAVYSIYISQGAIEIALKNYIKYPRAIDYITNYWLVNSSIWKRIYVNAWCVNGYVTSVAYSLYLIGTNQWVVDLKKNSILKNFLLGCFGLMLSSLFYSGAIFNPYKPLSPKVSAVIVNDIGLIGMFPIIWISVTVSFFAGLAFFYVVILQISNFRSR